MNALALLERLKKTAEFKTLRGGLDKELRQQSVFGLGGSQRNLLAAGLIDEEERTSLVVAPDEQEAVKTAGDLTTLLPGARVCRFPAWEVLPYQVYAQSKEVLSQRLKVLESLCRGERLVIVASVQSLVRRLGPPGKFCRTGMPVSVGDVLEPEEFIRQLVSWGYERVDMVEGGGQFSSRGGIIDVFTMTAGDPVRIEFFDDEVDSIRSFDVETQRSKKMLSKAEFYPAREIVIDRSAWERAFGELSKDYEKQLRRFRADRSRVSEQELVDNLAPVLDNVKAKNYFNGMELFISYFYPQAAALTDYLPENSLCIMIEPARIIDVLKTGRKEREELFSDLLARGKILPGQFNAYIEEREFFHNFERCRIVFNSFFPRQPNFLKPRNIVNLNARQVGGFMGRVELLAEEIRRWRKRGFAVVLLVSTGDRAQRLQEALRDEEMNVSITSMPGINVPEEIPVITIMEGQLDNSFELPAARLAVVTDSDIFGFRKKTGAKRPSPQEDISLRDDLSPGDYVVHVNHGIGRFEGIVNLKVGDVCRDYMLLKYHGEDKLYVPTDQVDMIQKYVGADGERPRLSKLGGAEWSRVKKRVKREVKDLAQDLLKLYASRQSMPGYAFSKDTPWQQEFEALFPYEETPDQLRATEEVKADMEKPRPMDRLLCGDVGYGKTEVALRAAFKAVMDGKQVAVLVPTTILAQQHYNTFTERFAGYPVRVEMLSRFRTAQEQKKIVQSLKSGVVDIVIGTHRLVQKDVSFKDLGLLIIDEEQRFGVAHKERLKLLRKEVDVLTLTATPIPRTLYMSMVGVRDTSILETPPEDRFPIQTYVLEEDPVIIREAIKRELARGGQVYFVHNRVRDLDRVGAWVQSLVPEAKVAVAHGQMNEDKLEKVMIDFMDGRYDVLVCTTIIENGLDIPNVNTLVIKEADNLGLAQLYQVRGRVGRANRLAYAYITFRKDKVLSESAEKRLMAIKEFTDLGSGYRLAMRDLEIRGAGNLLGVEQHGHITAVGFDMYCRLLEEAVREVRGEKVEKEVNTTVELTVNAFIPDDYIVDENQKIEFYRRIAAVKNMEDVDDLADELMDRFGDLPEPVQNLLSVARIKVLGKQLRIKAINRMGRYYRLLFDHDHLLTGERLVAVGKEYGNSVKFKSGEEFEIRYIAWGSGEENRESLKRLENFLAVLRPENTLPVNSEIR